MRSARKARQWVWLLLLLAGSGWYMAVGAVASQPAVAVGGATALAVDPVASQPAVAVGGATALAVDPVSKQQAVAAVHATALAVGALAPTAVWPIFGHATPCPYCEVVGAAIDGAVSSVDALLASLAIEDDPLVETLVSAADRGVAVRVLLDASSFEPSVTEKSAAAAAYLVAHGIDARLDDPEITIHAKLIVVDRTSVVVGSTNWNRYALLDHRQADVRIDDARVGRVFGAFFDRLWANPAAVLPLMLDGDGVAASADGPVLLGLPDAGASTLYASAVADFLARARMSVHAVLYRVSIYPQFADSATTMLVRELLAAAQRGLDVRVLIDDCSPYADSAEENLESAIYLYQSGVDVRLDAPDITTHAKLLVIDGETVVLGSTNWNYYSVERNIEANVALARMPEVAAAFELYFAALWAEGRSIVP